MVNGFSTDPQVLLDTLNRKGMIEGVDISPILITPSEQQNEEKRQDQLLTTGNINSPNASPEEKQAILGAINSMRQFVSDQTSFSDDARVKMTLAAMDQLGRYLSPFPERKNLIWFSASFPIGVDPDFNQIDAYRMMRDYSIDIRKTAQRLALARVAVYPIDARRFFQAPQFDPHSSGESMNRNAYYRGQSIDLAFDTVTKEHDTMDQIAEETGGRAIYNTNDLKGAMGEVIGSGDVYYTLAYDPANQKLDGRYHKIVVKFSQPGYKVLYRHGYVAEDAKANAKKPEQPNKERTAQANTLFRAEMEPGGPPVSEILFRLEPIVEPNQPATADPTKGDNPKMTKPVVRYVFEYAADVGGMQMARTQDGIRHGLLLAMIIAYDKQGQPLNSVLNTETLDLDPKVYTDSLRTGLPFYQELDIPPGEVTVRVGVYDVISSKMGAFEFPLTVQSLR
jgi:VWFA-related protein